MKNLVLKALFFLHSEMLAKHGGAPGIPHLIQVHVSSTSTSHPCPHLIHISPMSTSHPQPLLLQVYISSTSPDQKRAGEGSTQCWVRSLQPTRWSISCGGVCSVQPKSHTLCPGDGKGNCVGGPAQADLHPALHQGEF